MPPKDNQTSPTKKRILLIIFIAVGAAIIILLSVLILSLRNKNRLIGAQHNEISDLVNRIDEEQAKLKNIAFAVHPESEYENFRKKAYIEKFQQSYPDETVDIHDMILVRVYHTTSFREADPVFSKIQNDDILVYDDRLAKKSEKVPVIIVRPREQRILLKEQILTQSLNKARSNNYSTSPFGQPVNYFSQQ